MGSFLGCESFSQQDKPAYLVIGLFVVLLFAPIFTGSFVVGGTDSLFNHFPNLIFGYDEWSAHKRLAFWNPYNFAGFDMTGSMHARHLNPLYWPLFLLDRSHILFGLTIIFFLSALTVAICWYRLSRCFELNVPCATIVACVSTGGMFFWFTTTTLIAVSMYAATSLAILLCFTSEKRSRWKQYLILTLVFSVILLSAHPSYILGFGLPILVAVLFIEVRAYQDKTLNFQRPLLILLAGLSALLLASYRLVPAFLNLLDGNVIGLDSGRTWLTIPTDNYSPFLLTLLNPYALGTSISENFSVLRSIGLGGLRHGQIHNALYFGVLPFLFVVIALFSAKKHRLFFLLLTLFLLLLNANALGFSPFLDIVYSIFYPIIHDPMFRILSNFSFLALLVVSLGSLNSVEVFRSKTLVRLVILMVALVAIVQILIYARSALLHTLSSDSWRDQAFLVSNCFRIALVMFLGCTAFLLWKPRLMDKPGLLIGAAGFILFLSILGLVLSEIFFKNRNQMVYYALSDLWASLLASGLSISIATGAWSRMNMSLKALWTFGFVAAIFLVVFRMTGHTDAASPGNHPLIALYAFIGASKLVILSMVFVFLGRCLVSSGRTASLFTSVPFILLIAVDLLGGYRAYSYINMGEPFSKTFEQLYPPRDIVRLYPPRDLGHSHPEKNLIKKDAFSLPFDDKNTWRFGGSGLDYCQSNLGKVWSGGRVLEICASTSSGAGGNFYKDFSLETGQRMAHFGLWARVSAGPAGKIFITNPSAQRGGSTASIPADHKWHWVEVQIDLISDKQVVRPHISMVRGQKLSLYAPVLASNGPLWPVNRPEDGDYVMPKTWEEKVNSDQFRSNYVHRLLKIRSNEALSNFASVYRVRTYGGVDSDMPREWIEFLKNFVKLEPDWFHRAGILSKISNTRLLDLLGVRYTLDDQGALTFRRTAVPRFLALARAEPVDDFGTALKRIKDPSFNPLTTAIIEGGQAFTGGEMSRGETLDYKTINSDHLEVPISERHPRIISFGDRYNVGWRAYWNGKELPILRANGAFMAIHIPEGEGIIVLKFQPPLFYLGLKITLLGLLISFLLFVLFFFLDKVRGSLHPYRGAV